MNAPVLQPTTELFLNPGDVLYHEGQSPESAYIITSGEVCIFRERDGKRENIETRGRGATLGELAILTGTPLYVSVEAVTPCRLYQISNHQIQHRFSKIDPFLQSCLKTSLGFVRRHSLPTDSAKDLSVVCETSSDVDALIEQLQFEHEILAGLENNNFSMVYQPIVRLSDERIVGAEALMRWHHPVMGHIPPDRFIQAAERMGEISRFTDFALLETCAMLSRMRKAGECDDHFYATVNISNADLERPEFFDFLVHALDKNNLTTRNIKLELTETELVFQCASVQKNLDRLREFGCGIAIDDFGTGYSNLAYMKEIPLTALKIDRAFASDAALNPTSHSIVKMIITLGHELGVWVVAEGLETKEDVKTLRDLGCELAQGYHFAKPMTETDLAEMIGMPSNAQSNVA